MPMSCWEKPTTVTSPNCPSLNVVPNMVVAFHAMIRADDEIRALLETLDVWKLEEGT